MKEILKKDLEMGNGEVYNDLSNYVLTSIYYFTIFFFNYMIPFRNLFYTSNSYGRKYETLALFSGP